jgi:hypothetical protein
MTTLDKDKLTNVSDEADDVEDGLETGDLEDSHRYSRRDRRRQELLALEDGEDSSTHAY